ncbi:MAG TPA: HAD-IA family hydrolase [Acidimicrobiales bacterium]
MAFGAIIFDAEGVVIDTEGLWDEAQGELLARRGISYDREQVKPLLSGRSAEDGVRIIKDRYALADEVPALVAERRTIALGLFARVDFVSGFVDFFRAADRTYRTALATAMDPPLFAVADAGLGLSAMFHDRVSTVLQVGGRGKPAPDLFVHAAGLVAESADRCLVIEDAPHGIEAARRAGMACIALTTTFAAALLTGADVVVSSFDEVDGAIRSLG